MTGSMFATVMAVTLGTCMVWHLIRAHASDRIESWLAALFYALLIVVNVLLEIAKQLEALQ